MASNTVMVQAASGLAKLMTGNPDTGVFKDSTVAQISAALFYQANVMAHVTTSKSFEKEFRNVIFTQIQKDFGEYIDAKARVEPSRYHHVYEWKRAGDPSARLFKLTAKDAEGLSFKIASQFLMSKTAVPNNFSDRRHVFKNKAFVMEEGMPLVIKPKNAERLVFEVRGSMVFLPKGQSVTIKSAGGGKTTKKFQIAYAQFFRGNLVNLSIKKSGFQNIFNKKIGKALNLPVDIKTVRYKFSPNSVLANARASVDAAFGVIS